MTLYKCPQCGEVVDEDVNGDDTVIVDDEPCLECLSEHDEAEYQRKTMGHYIEAVQFHEFGRWHAMRDSHGNLTFCGLNAISAKRMWESWAEKVDCCRKCEKAVARVLSHSGDTSEAQ